jgi:hypothetical protein
MKLGIVIMLIASLSVALVSILQKSCNSTDISRKSNRATKGTHNARYSISRKSNKSNRATKGTRMCDDEVKLLSPLHRVTGRR